MGRVRDVLVLKTNTKNFINVIGLLVGMAAISTLPSSPTQALSLAPLGLVRDTTNLVKNTTTPLLNVLAPEKLATPQTVSSPTAPSMTRLSSTASTNTSSGTTSSSKNTSTASSVLSAPAAQTPASSSASYVPLSTDDIQPIDLSSQSSVSPHAALLAAVTSTSSLPELNEILHPALLQATTNGWQIGGVMWYWWLAILVAIGGLGYFVYYHYKLYMRQKQLVS